MNPDAAVGQPERARRVHWMNQVARHATVCPDRAAIRFNGVTTTWSQLNDRIARVASAMTRHGVGFGDRVALLMGNRQEFLEVALAANLIGAIAVPINFRLTPTEIAYIVGDSGSTLLVSDELGTGKLAGILADLDTSPVVVSVEPEPGWQPYSDFLRADPLPEPDMPDVEENAPSLIMYTSGTTGHPKGAVLSHLNLQTQSTMVAQTFQYVDQEEVSLVASPMFHVGALGLMLPTIYIGGTLVIHPSRAFAAAEILDTLEAEKVTSTFLVPTQWQAVCDDPTIAERDLAALRVLSWGAAPADDRLLRRMSELFPTAMNIAVFGQTEMAPVTCMLHGRDAIRKLGSVGRPVAAVATRIVTPEMKDVAPGEVGEIVYRGPGLMLGYWNKPEATAESFRGGWFHSGDLVRADDEGFVYVVDRAKDMIISGGENIYSAEVENVLGSHPDVYEVGIVGRPHPVWGETPVAYVVPRDPQVPVDVESLREWGGRYLARYKLPTEIEIIEALPRNASGKILKDNLRSTQV